MDDIRQSLGEVIEWLQQDDASSRQLRRTFVIWLGRSLLPARFPGVEMPEMRNLLEIKDMLSERVVEWTKEWEQRGLEQGLEQGAAKTAERMLVEGFAIDVIVRMTGLSEKKIETLKPKH